MNYELYIFGSILSGDVDAGSDIDVLAIVEGEVVKGMFPNNWSTYSAERISQLFRRGTLFAWHLHLESMIVYPNSDEHTLSRLGRPSEYNSAASEIGSLKDIAKRAIAEIEDSTPSIVFEFGLLFLTARDIAMAASQKLTGKFDFSRYAPLRLQNFGFPFDRYEYEFLMGCRRASTRGQVHVWNLSLEKSISAKSQQFLDWCERIHSEVSTCSTF